MAERKDTVEIPAEVAAEFSPSPSNSVVDG